MASRLCGSLLMLISIHSCLGRNFIRQTVDPEQSLTFCNNTVQGPHFVADNHGYICSTMAVDPKRGCCPEEGPKFSCLGCNEESHCCNSFEFCVSCCQNPEKTTAEFALHTKVSTQSKSARYGSVFDYCTGRCRHNSGSVVHENAYASEEHHCYFTQLNISAPTEKPTSHYSNDTDYSLIVGRQGQSCDGACEERVLVCNASRLVDINKCSMLERYGNCKGSCIVGDGGDRPSEVVSTAPRHMHPGACLLSNKETNLSCKGAHRYTRRLCPCV